MMMTTVRPSDNDEGNCDNERNDDDDDDDDDDDENDDDKDYHQEDVFDTRCIFLLQSF